MEELLNGAGTFLRVMLATVFFVTPGMAFWLVVAGILVAIRRFGRSNLYLTMRNRLRPAASTPS